MGHNRIGAFCFTVLAVGAPTVTLRAARGSDVSPGSSRPSLSDHSRLACQFRWSSMKVELQYYLRSYPARRRSRSEEHTSELTSLMCHSYAVFRFTQQHNAEQ